MNENRLRQIVREELEAIMVNEPVALMTPKEVAEHLNVTIETLAVWRCKGKGPAYTKAGGITYRVADVNAYVEGKRVKTN